MYLTRIYNILEMTKLKRVKGDEGPKGGCDNKKTQWKILTLMEQFRVFTIVLDIQTYTLDKIA